MDQIENLLMRIARVFGIVVMSLTLAFAGVFVLVLTVRFVGSLFEQSHPNVKFFPADFKQANQTDSIEVPADDPDARYSAKILEEVVPAYQKVTEDYIARKAEDLGLKESADRQKAVDERVKNFRAGSDASLRQVLSGIDADEKKRYASNLADYLESAQSGGVDPYTEGGTPISNLLYSTVYQKFHQKFSTQLAALKKSSDDSIGAIAGRAAIYMGLAGCVLVFLLQAMMFAILRIEKKIRKAD